MNVRSSLGRRGLLLAVAAGVLLTSDLAWAQDEKFPAKPIEVVIHSKYGGGTDTIHKVDEKVKASDLDELSLIYEEILIQLLSQK